MNQTLTERELEVVRLLVAGYTVNEIAADTHRHRSTIYGHLARVRDRLAVRTDAEIAVQAMKLGLVKESKTD